VTSLKIYRRLFLFPLLLKIVELSLKKTRQHRLSWNIFINSYRIETVYHFIHILFYTTKKKMFLVQMTVLFDKTLLLSSFKFKWRPHHLLFVYVMHCFHCQNVHILFAIYFVHYCIACCYFLSQCDEKKNIFIIGSLGLSETYHAVDANFYELFDK